MKILRVVTKSNSKLTKQQEEEIFQIEENVDSKGKIIVSMKESEINPLLRTIFKNKPEKIIIQLQNSSINPEHAQSLYNIIKASPFKGIVLIKHL